MTQITTSLIVPPLPIGARLGTHGRTSRTGALPPLSPPEQTGQVTHEKSERAQTESVEPLIRPPSVRSLFSIDPARELKPMHTDPRSDLIRKYYLDIAHYDGDRPLVDTFA